MGWSLNRMVKLNKKIYYKNYKMIFEKVREIVAEQLGISEDEIKLETNFVDDLGADSLDLFQVVMELEDAFDVKVEEVDGLKTVADAVKYIETATQK